MWSFTHMQHAGVAGGFIFFCHHLGRWSNLTNIFQLVEITTRRSTSLSQKWTVHPWRMMLELGLRSPLRYQLEICQDGKRTCLRYVPSPSEDQFSFVLLSQLNSFIILLTIEGFSTFTSPFSIVIYSFFAEFTKLHLSHKQMRMCSALVCWIRTRIPFCSKQRPRNMLSSQLSNLISST